MERTGVVIFAHGSPVAEANDSVRRVAEAMSGDYELVAPAFLESAEPTLAAAVEALVARGADRIVVAPYFLTLGLHLRRDLPRMVAEVAARTPGVAIEVTPPLEGHPALLDALRDRVRAAS
jgi:sirohydrochlorin ferrochelatase